MYSIKGKFDDGFGGKIVMWEQMKCHEYGAQTSTLHHQILPCLYPGLESVKYRRKTKASIQSAIFPWPRPGIRNFVYLTSTLSISTPDETFDVVYII